MKWVLRVLMSLTSSGLQGPAKADYILTSSTAGSTPLRPRDQRRR